MMNKFGSNDNMSLMRFMFEGGKSTVMVGKRICGDIWLGSWWCNVFGIYEVLDGVAKEHAWVDAMAITLVVFAILGWVVVSG